MNIFLFLSTQTLCSTYLTHIPPPPQMDFFVVSVISLYYHRGSNCGSSTRGTAHTRYVFIGCCDSGNNPDSNACQIYWRKYIWTPLRWKLVLSCDEVIPYIYHTHAIHTIHFITAAYKVFFLHHTFMTTPYQETLHTLFCGVYIVFLFGRPLEIFYRVHTYLTFYNV